jgi:hypothetical protein
MMIETWRGFKTDKIDPLQKTKTQKRQRSTKYMDNFPEIDRILNTLRLRSHLNSLILNGNISATCKFKKNVYILNNTCPFDATLVGICVAYIDYEIFRVRVDSSKNEMLCMAKDIALNGSSSITYHKRLELIMQHFEVQSSIPLLNT